MPGLNDSVLSEEIFLPVVLKALEMASSIHLVVFMVINGPVSKGLMDTVRAHIDLWLEFHGNIAFVHTKIEQDDEDIQCDQAYHKRKVYVDPRFAQHVLNKVGVHAHNIEIDEQKSKKADLQRILAELKGAKADQQQLEAEGVVGLEEIRAHVEELRLRWNILAKYLRHSDGSGSSGWKVDEKSTFIECARNNVDPEHAVNWSPIGNSVESKIGTTKQFTVTSDLPGHEVRHNTDNAPTTPTPYAESNPDPAPLGTVKINLLDQSGINDTNYQDVEHAKRIINEMVKTKAFNLIVVIIVNSEIPIHMEQVAFRFYSSVIHAIQGHHDNVIFVYTHVEYIATTPTRATTKRWTRRTGLSSVSSRNVQSRRRAEPAT
ncbi:hypothetical protein BGZ81_004773 [Podila clonocystis]|nr:hypothetical protein BGZ81_004773 [Podila clonocystis]